MGALFVIIAVVGFVAASYLYYGWLLWLAWSWWGADFGLPTLPFGHAVVIVFLVGILTSNPTAETKEADEALGMILLAMMSAGITLWVLGLLVN